MFWSHFTWCWEANEQKWELEVNFLIINTLLSCPLSLFYLTLSLTTNIILYFSLFPEPNLWPSGLIVYLGMMVGAFVWGGLADRIGRRQTLLIALSINSVFAFFSSFVQGYVSFLFCRLASGVGYEDTSHAVTINDAVTTAELQQFAWQTVMVHIKGQYCSYILRRKNKSYLSEFFY